MERRQISSPYGAPNTPIASAKRPHHHLEASTQFDLPLQRLRTFELSFESESSGDELKHNETDLFSPHLKLAHHDDVNRDSQHDESASSLALVATQELEEDDQSTEEIYEEFDPYYFIYTLPPHSSVMKHGKICLPPPIYHHKRTLVLDLDETLVHCSVEPTSKSDFTFPVTYNAVNYQVYVKKRPYVDYFLESVSKEFEVIVFTASQQVYADRLLDYLDPHKKYFASRLFREACLDVYGNFIKDLTVLNRDLSKTVLVDNSPYAYGYHVDNGIPIESWFDDENDTELLKLIGFLRRLHSAEDVRHILRDHFKTFLLIENAGLVNSQFSSQPSSSSASISAAASSGTPAGTGSGSSSSNGATEERR